MQFTQYESLRSDISNLAYRNRSCRTYFDVKTRLPVQNIPNQVELTVNHTKAALKRGLVRQMKDKVTDTGIWGVVFEQTDPNKTRTVLQIMVDPKLVKDLNENLSERRASILLERVEDLGWATPVSSNFKTNAVEYCALSWNWTSRNQYREWVQHQAYRSIVPLKQFEEIQMWFSHRMFGLMEHTLSRSQDDTSYSLERDVLKRLQGEIYSILCDTPNWDQAKRDVAVSNWYNKFVCE